MEIDDIIIIVILEYEKKYVCVLLKIRKITHRRHEPIILFFCRLSINQITRISYSVKVKKNKKLASIFTLFLFFNYNYRAMWSIVVKTFVHISE